MTRIWGERFDRSLVHVLVEKKSVTMAEDPGALWQQLSRPVCARLITWGFILFYFYKCLGASAGALDDILLCRQCGHEIAKAGSLIKVPSPNAEYQRNDTILGVQGVLIQLFINPHGAHFEVITAKTADVYKENQAVEAYSWFPGFLWRIVMCPRCGFHLGWAFQPTGQLPKEEENEKSFIGLILGNLQHKDYADNLIVTPKFQKS